MTRRQSSRCAPEAGAANHFSGVLPTAEQLERMQEYSLTIKQESDVRAAAARLPGGFVDAGDILDLLRMGM